jgi:uncharacterized membrane protein
MSKHKYKILFIVLAIIGLLDATYLTTESLLHKPVVCSIIAGCQNVLSSNYAHIGRIPLSMFGLVYYLFLILTAAASLHSRISIYPKLLKYGTSIGLIVSCVLVYLMIFVIKSICVYCFISAIITTLLFFIARYGISKQLEVEIDIKL